MKYAVGSDLDTPTTARIDLLNDSGQYLANMYYKTRYPEPYIREFVVDGGIVVEMTVRVKPDVDDTQPFGTIRRVDEDDANAD